MRFETYTYQRPSMEAFTAAFEALLEQFEHAASLEEQDLTFRQVNEARSRFLSLYNISYIRHTINTQDSYYEEENRFFDEQMPHYQALNTRFYQSLLASRFREGLEKKWGRQLFSLAGLSLKTFQPSILEDLQEENRLCTAYNKLKAEAKISFRGEDYNLSSIAVMETAADRQTRKEAARAKWDFFARNADQLDGIFDQLVRVRHRMAVKLGFRNFVELGYARMARTDYDAEMVARFRQQVATHILPLALELFERQRRRLNLKKLKFYDEDFRFPSGNPRPKGNADDIVRYATEMYAALSPETDVFFRYMLDNHLMDLVTRPNKVTGGYCTYIDQYQAPFIFSNFTGTSSDVDVLTHEAGHAFQVFSSKDLGISEYNWPTVEACEIHSMSMEFFTWPWMSLFFGNETEKYHFAHLSGALCFLPYGVAVDEFQHFVYENPEASPADRHRAWKAIEAKYLPQRDYDGLSYLMEGAFWQKQSHIYASPFYYIDYCLAQICAFQFWQKDRQDHAAAWQDYLRLCRAGGSQSFLELVDLAGLRSPFGEGCVASVAGEIRALLSQIDDSAF